MGHKLTDLLTRLDANAPIPVSILLECSDVDDLNTRAVVVELLRHHGRRIYPPVQLHQFGRFLIEYYIACIVTPTTLSCAERRWHSPYEAAGDLVLLLKQCWDNRTTATDVLTLLCSRVTDTYVNGTHTTRLCIETGFLEHVFEYQPLRSLFDSWKHKVDLADAHQRALEWGKSHERKSM